MMYKHIIETMSTELNIQFEDGIMKAVRDVGVIVDKEELVKALMYDRNQYDEGYRDGKKDTMKWIPVSERLPEKEKKVLVSSKSGYVTCGVYITTGFVCGNTFWKLGEMGAWMPLPSPWKGEEK